MPMAKTRAIVLRTLKFGDTSRICTLYTRDYGKVKVLAKGARTPKSRTGAGLNLFVENQVVFSLREGRELHTLGKCELVREHRGLESDPLRFAHAAVAAEMVDRVSAGEEARGELYDLLRETLARLDAAPADRLPLALWYFALQLTALLGYLPRLDACASCGRPVGESGRLGMVEGGLLCAACGTGREGTMELTSGAVAILRLLAREAWEPVSRVRPARPQAAEIESALLGYLHAQALGPRALRAMGVLRRLRKGWA